METSTPSSGRCATRPTSIGTAGRLGSEVVADIISECPADIIGIRTYRQLSPAHAPRYLASFAWRFNRRFQLDTMMPRFLHSAARTQPLPYRLLIAG